MPDPQALHDCIAGRALASGPDALGADQLALMITAASLVHDDDEALRRLTSAAVRVGGADPLTGLPGHTATWQAFEREWQLAQRHGRPLTLLMVDLAHFKSINDTIGHINGDRLLVRVAQLLQSSVRSTDIVGRIGGDEFMVIMPDADAEAARSLMRRASAHLMPMKRSQIVPPDFELSYGVCDAVDGGSEAMFQAAEAMLYDDRGRSLQADNTPVSLPRLQVLVVESDPHLRSQARDILAMRGYEVDVAERVDMINEPCQADVAVVEAPGEVEASVVIISGTPDQLQNVSLDRIRLVKPYSDADLIGAVDVALERLS